MSYLQNSQGRVLLFMLNMSCLTSKHNNIKKELMMNSPINLLLALQSLGLYTQEIVALKKTLEIY